jgi:hypothetical protein
MSGFTDPAFIRALEEKAVSYYVGADRENSPLTKARFPKRITEDPRFKSIRYLRRRHRAEQRAQELPSELLNEHREQILGSYDSEPARMLAETFIDAVRQGEIDRLEEIVKLCKLLETRLYQQPTERQSDPHRWHYYAAVVTCGFLKEGIVPTKGEVKKAALKERAIVELPKRDPSWKPKEVRIDTDSDTRRYYEAQQGDPYDDPNRSLETPVKHDLSDEERTRITQLLRERIIQWQREQQAASRTQRPQRLAEEKKPVLVKDREKRIAAKIEELRRLYKPKIWARIWARVFSDLGLGGLPRY